MPHAVLHSNGGAVESTAVYQAGPVIIMVVIVVVSSVITLPLAHLGWMWYCTINQDGDALALVRDHTIKVACNKQ